MVVCKLCNTLFKRIEWHHLKYKHNVTLTEYHKMFPDAAFIDDSFRQRVSVSVKKTFLDKFGGNPSQLPEKKVKRQQTMLKRYGVANAMQSPELKDKCVLKRDQTLLTRYGVTNPSKIEGSKQKRVDAVRKTCMLKYGVSHYMKVPFLCNKQKKKKEQTLYNRYGVTNPMHVAKFAQKNVDSNQKPITSIEKKIINLNIPFLKFVGNGKFWRTLILNNKRINKNPDFVFIDQRKIIEVFGDYWHRKDIPQDLIDAYANIGYTTLVLWEKDIRKMSNDVLRLKIQQFYSNSPSEIIR